MLHHWCTKRSLKKIRYRFQLNALAREFVEVAIVSQGRFEDGRLTLRSWIDTQKKPLGDIKANNPTKPPTKAQKRKDAKMATGGKKKKKNTSEPQASEGQPPPPPSPQVYLTPSFVPFFSQGPLASQPSGEEGGDDVVVLRKVPPPSPFRGVPPLPVPPPSGLPQLSQGTQSSQLS